MSKRFKQVNIQQFAILVQEVDISKYSQKEYVDIIEEIYMTIFRHNTNGDFVIPTMPNEEGTWKVHKSSATKEEVMKLIYKDRNNIVYNDKKRNIQYTYSALGFIKEKSYANKKN